MDNICVILERLGSLINSTPEIPLVFAETGMPPYIFTPERPLIEFLYCQEGSLSLMVGDTGPYAVPTGRMAVINAHAGNRGSALRPGSRYGCFSLDISGLPDLADLGSRPLFLERAVVNRDRLISRYRDLTFTFPAPASVLRTISLKAAILDVIGILLAEGTGRGTGIPAGVSARIRDILGFMTESQDDPGLTLEKIASAAGLSVSRFGRIFREETGKSPMQYLLDLRISRARYLLEKTGLPVKRICYQTGFNDQLYFSRAFSRLTGVCPSRYRNERVATR